jgi:DNA-binding NarL/FixJ family response regulator
MFVCSDGSERDIPLRVHYMLQERGKRSVEKTGGSRTAPKQVACHDSSMTTVLIVDDHGSFRATARKLLEAEGFEVVGEAGSGEAALEAVERLRPDVVLLDVQLPDMDGFDVAARLPKNGYRPAVVLTSSRDVSEFRGLVEQSGARGFVPKDELSGRRIAALLP